MTTASPRIPIDEHPSGTRYAREWRKTLLAFIPFGALAFFVGWALEVPSGQATSFDLLWYPVMGFLLLGLEVVLALGRRTLPFVVLAVIAGASVFFFCKLGWLLFMAPPEVDIQAQLTETLFWIPVVYLLSFILEEGRLGQWIVRAFTGAMLVLAVAYSVPGIMRGAPNWGVIYAIIELNLANTVFLALTYAKEHGAPYELLRYVHEHGRLPVVNFAAGGIATPADAALMMQLGVDGVFVGSGIFKAAASEADEGRRHQAWARRAEAIVKAVTHFDDPAILAEVSKGLGEAMVGISMESLAEDQLLARRGW